MNTTEINDIVISDKQEHLRIITEDIVIQSNKLTHILEERDGLICDINTKKEELKLIESKCSNVYSNIINLESTKERIEIEVKDLEHEKSLLEKYIEEVEDDIANLNNSYGNLYIQYNKIIQSLIDEKNILLGEVVKIQESLDSNSEYSTKKQVKVQELKTLFEEIKKDKEDFEAKYKLEKEEKLDNLKNIQEELDNAVATIANPLQSLNKREGEIEKRERNLNILIARFRTEFKKLHPDLNPVI